MTAPSGAGPARAQQFARGWFGEPWWSFVCYDEDGRLLEERRLPFPSGESCLYCEELLDEAAGDSGEAMTAVTLEGARQAYMHKECQMRQVIGGLAHHEGRCHCHGGDGQETPGMTRRQEALEVWRRLQEGSLFGR
ncbi:MAG TPA: hypothetical protein VGD91_08275 [Trebonia sp.]